MRLLYYFALHQNRKIERVNHNSVNFISCFQMRELGSTKDARCER